MQQQQKKKKGRRYEEFDLSKLPIVEVIEYTDPNRDTMAQICRIYMGMPDLDKTRPLRLIVREEDSFLECLDIQVRVISTVACRDQAFRNRLARAVAARGFRANVPSQILPPIELQGDPRKLAIFEEKAARIINDIDELIELGFKPQEARGLAAMHSVCEWSYRVNARLLAHSIFKDRLWTKGAQKEIRIFAQRLWDQLYAKDPELWSYIEWVYGPETLEWRRLGKEIRKLRQDAPWQVWARKKGEEPKTNYVELKDGRRISSLTAEEFYQYVKEFGLEKENLFNALVGIFKPEKSMWE